MQQATFLPWIKKQKRSPCYHLRTILLLSHVQFALHKHVGPSGSALQNAKGCWRASQLQNASHSIDSHCVWDVNNFSVILNLLFPHAAMDSHHQSTSHCLSCIISNLRVKHLRLVCNRCKLGSHCANAKLSASHHLTKHTGSAQRNYYDIHKIGTRCTHLLQCTSTDKQHVSKLMRNCGLAIVLAITYKQKHSFSGQTKMYKYMNAYKHTMCPINFQQNQNMQVPCCWTEPR